MPEPIRWTTEAILTRLRGERAVFDAKVAAIPRRRFEEVPPGRQHSPKEIVAHVTAYEELIVGRLRAARQGVSTEYDRDRVGWEAFNDRIWEEAREAAWSDVMGRAREVFADLLGEIATLSDDELNGSHGVTAAIDPAWLKGRPLAEMIAIDGFEHYPMHYDHLTEAASD